MLSIFESMGIRGHEEVVFCQDKDTGLRAIIAIHNTTPKLKCSIIAGAANNQLKRENEHAEMIKYRGVLYAPDYAINAAGLINCANEIEGYNRERAFRQAEEGIFDTLTEIYKRAETDNVTTHTAASKVAEKRMLDVTKLKNVYLPKKNVLGKRDNA